MMAYSVVPESFTSLQKPWGELLAMSSTNHVFLTPQWQRAWWQVFGNGNELCLLSVRQASQLVGIAPMMRKGERLSFIGSSDVCDYMDFIARQGQEVFVFSQLLDYLESMEWSSINLESLLPHSLAMTYLVPLCQRRGYQVDITQVDVSPQLVLPSSWDEYLSQLKAKDRHELRRKFRRLEQTKATRHYIISQAEQLPQALDRFLELFKMSSVQKVSFMTDRKREFFETIVSSLADAGHVRLSFLEVGGIPATSSLCFDYENELYLYNSAYNPAHAPLSAGLLLKAICIGEAIKEGKKRFDFLRGDEPYKYDLGGQNVPIYRCVISRS